MSIERIKQILNEMGPAERINRENTVDQILEELTLLPSLIDVIFQTNFPQHHKAAWTLEILLERDLYAIIDYLEVFTSQLHTVKHQSALRAISKICLWISQAYSKKQDPIFLKNLSPKQIHRIVENSFDWLIGKNKVATKAYTMASLYHLGNLPNKEFAWIHKELNLTILQNIEGSSPAYQAQGKKILRLLGRYTAS